MTAVLRPEALRDLEDSLGYIQDRDPAAAEDLRREVFRLFDDLDAHRMDGPSQVLRSGRRVRRFYVHPFWVYDQRDPGDVLTVLRVCHYARKPLR